MSTILSWASGAIALAALVIPTTAAAEPHWQVGAQKIYSNYGVTVVFDEIEVPTYWKSWNPKWRTVPTDARSDCIRKLRLDLSNYDAAYVRKHLSKVFVLAGLSFNDADYGGTNDHIHKWLYIHAKWLGDDGSHKDAMGFHHEFSSILYKRNKGKFDEDAWRDVNVSDFEYAFEKSLEQNIRSGSIGLRGTPELYRAGFVCKYGQLTLEDDINTFAQQLLAKPGLLATRSADYIRLRKKSELLMAFLHETGYARGPTVIESQSTHH